MHYEDLFLLTAAGGVLMDLREARVDNRWILLSLSCGLFAHSIRDGPKGLISGLLGVLSAFALLFWLHFFHMLGAGDIKFLMALVPFMGVRWYLYAVIISFLIGAVISAYLLIRDRDRTRTIHFAVPVGISVMLCLLLEQIGVQSISLF